MTTTPSHKDLTAKSTALLLLAILALGLFLRTFNLQNEAAWFDEIVTLRYLGADSLTEYLEGVRIRNPVHPPVYMIAQYTWSQIFGPSEIAARMLSILAGMLSLAMLFVITRHLFGNRAALVATLWMSLIPFHIYHAQEIRFYAFVTLLSLLSMYLFLKLIQTPRPHWWVLLTLTDLAIIWNHPLGAGLFTAQALFLLIYKRKQIPMLVAWTIQHLLIGATLLPWALRLEPDQSNQSLQWLDPPSIFGRGPALEAVLRTAVGEMSYLPTNPIGNSIFQHKPFLTGILLTTYLIAILYLIATRRKNTHQPNTPLPYKQALVLTASWFVVPLIALFILSYIWRPAFISRYVIYTMFPLYILIGAFIAQLNPRIRTYIFTLLLLLNIAYQAAFHFPGPYRARYDQATAIITQHRTAPEPVLTVKPMDDRAMRYRLDHEQIPVTLLKPQSRLLAELDEIDKDKTPRWLISSTYGITQQLLWECEQQNRPHKVYDLTASLYLVVVNVQPLETETIPNP